MPAIQNIQVGDVCPIELLLGDGATDQYPQAKVYNQNSSLLITINLSHDHEGNYSGTPYNMPNTDFIKVIYTVYSDAPHTTESTNHEKDMDIFYKINPDEFKLDVAGIFTRVVEGTITFEQLQRLLLARAAGSADGGGTTDINFRDQLDTKNRITMEVDENGNRSSVVVDGT